VLDFIEIGLLVMAIASVSILLWVLRRMQKLIQKIEKKIEEEKR